MKTGDRIELARDIIDDGQDHHPPSVLGHKGEVLTVVAVGEGRIHVAHAGAVGSFAVFDGEYRPNNAYTSNGTDKHEKR